VINTRAGIILWTSVAAACLSLMSYLIFNEKEDTLISIGFILAAAIFIPLIASNIYFSLKILVFLAPLSLGYTIPGLGLKLSLPTEAITGIVAILFIVKVFSGMKWNKKIISHPISILLLLDMLWMLITVLMSDMTEVSLKRFVLKLAFLFVYFFMFANYFNKTKKHKLFYLLYILGAIIPILSAIIEHSKTGFIQATSFYVSQPFYSDHTIYGGCLAFVIPFLIILTYKNWKEKKPEYYLLLIISGAFIVAQFLSYSRASLLSLIIAGFFALLIYLKVKLKSILFFLLIGIGLFLANFQNIYQTLRENEVKYDENVGTHLTSVTNLQNDASNLERINRWVCAYRIFEDYPVFGIGPGTYQFVYDKYQTPEFMTRISTHEGNRGNAHSEYLTYLSEQGIMGLFIYLAIILSVLHTSFKLLYKKNLPRQTKSILLASLLGLITFYIHGLFNTFSDYEKMSILLYGSMGIIVSIDLATKQSNEEKAV